MAMSTRNDLFGGDKYIYRALHGYGQVSFSSLGEFFVINNSAHGINLLCRYHAIEILYSIKLPDHMNC